MTAEMKGWVRQLGLRPGEGTDRRLRHLAAALLAPKGLALEESSETFSAAETFRQRRGNCVSFALLLVALAREAGEPAYFALSDAVESWHVAGELRVTERHLAAAFGPREAMTVFDFGGSAKGEHGFLPVSDATATAIFLSNRGVERLLANQLPDALALFRAALEQDRQLAIAWLNLGVALRRSGDSRGARAAFRRSIYLEPEGFGAWKNLALLLDEGTPEDGAPPLGEGGPPPSPPRRAETLVGDFR